MASVPFDYSCDRANGFLMDPNNTRGVGYVTCLDGFGLAAGTTPPGLAQDLTVAIPYSPAAASRIAYPGLTLATGPANASLQNVRVVGVLETFAWEGSVGGALKVDFWVSHQNAALIKTLQQMPLRTTKINALGWWIIDYDHETKQWYEAAYPKSARTVTGMLQNRDNPELNVDMTPVPAADGVQVMVYKVSLAVVPGANLQYAAVSPATLHRRFRAELGTTPLAWLTGERVDLARRLLEAGDMTLEHVARHSGLGAAANLRAHPHQRTGLTPGAYRVRFGPGTTTNDARHA